jgi:hypothetical protein
MTDELEVCKQQNRILRELMGAMAMVVEELMQAMPDEIRALDNAQRAIAVCERIQKALAALDRPN